MKLKKAEQIVAIKNAKINALFFLIFKKFTILEFRKTFKNNDIT